MKTIYLNSQTPLPTETSVATIGFFDGVHVGHRHLVAQVVAQARRLHLSSMVITFDRPPREVLTGVVEPMLLTSLDEKLTLLRDTGVDTVVVLPFSKELAALTAREFMASVLCRQLHVCCLLIGYDNRFGRNRTEDFNDYVAYGHELGIDVMRAEELRVDGEGVGSSIIRRLLREGGVEAAARLLGRPYQLEGVVVHGYQQGRLMGFPTANLRPEPVVRLVPAAGVYAVEVVVRGADDEKWLPAMLNIGTRPTFDGHEQSIEAHILHFSADLYGQQLAVRFLRRIRGEHRFASVEELRRQLLTDREETRKILETHQKEYEDINKIMA